MEVEIYNKLTKLPMFSKEYQMFIDEGKVVLAEELAEADHFDKQKKSVRDMKLMDDNWINIPTLICCRIASNSMTSMTAVGITDERLIELNKISKALSNRPRVTMYLEVIRDFIAKCEESLRDELRFITSKTNIKNAYFTMCKNKNKGRVSLTVMRKKALDTRKSDKEAKKIQAKELALNGMNVKDIALELCEKDRTVRVWVTKELAAYKKTREALIIEMLSNGDTIKATAKWFNVSEKLVKNIKANSL